MGEYFLVPTTGKRTLLYTNGIVTSVSVITPVEFQPRPIRFSSTQIWGRHGEGKGKVGGEKMRGEGRGNNLNSMVQVIQ